MKLFSTIILIVLVNHLFSQEKSVSGKIFNDFDQSLSNVSITVNGTKKNVLSNCEGKFIVNVKKSDTLIFSKDGYLFKKECVHNYRKIKQTLYFDYKDFVQKLENDSLDKKLPNGGQPLFVVDGNVYNSNKKNEGTNLSEIYPDSIKSVIVLKGKEATDKFGRFAINGLIWISTKCN